MTISYPATYGSMIVSGTDLIDNSICDLLIKKLSPVYTNHASLGKTVGGVMSHVKRSHDLGLNSISFLEAGLSWDDEYQFIEDTVFSGFQKLLSFYLDDYPCIDEDWSNINDTGYQIQKYEQNYGFYKQHTDSFPSESINLSTRVLAGLLYLNDVEIGGETKFTLHDIEIKPEKGKFVLFPATFTHPHSAKRPISSDKWIISTFFTNTSASVVQEVVDHQHNDHSHGEHGDHDHNDF